VLRFCQNLFGTKFLALALVAPCLAVGACSSTMLLSEHVEEPGLIYYLPKTVVRLELATYGQIELREGAPPDSKDAKDFVERVREIRLESVTPFEIADVSRGYSLQYDRSVTSHDRVCMGVSEKGLLQSVEGAADDKTGDIIVSVAKLAGRVLGPGAFATAADVEKIYGKLRTLTVEIDPLNRTHWNQVNTAMRTTFGGSARNYHFRVEDIENLVRDASAPDTCPVNSVCYRTRVPVRFTLGTDRGATSSIYKEVVNRRVTGRIDVSRALMVEKITRLTFKDGVLAGVNIRKPSEGLAVAKLPLTVIDAVMTSALAAPGDFVGKAAGLPSAQATDLIKQAATNAAEIQNLQKSLETIRNGDLTTTSDATAAADAFQLKCTMPTFSPKT
jgi:hypothetical protein